MRFLKGSFYYFGDENVWKRERKSSSSIIAAVLIMSLVTSGLALLSYQASKQADKIEALSSSQRARNLSELLESSVEANKAGNVVWINLDKKPLGVIQVSKNMNKGTSIRFYNMSALPEVILYNGTHLGVDTRIDFNKTDLILVLENEGKIDLGEILRRKTTSFNGNKAENSNIDSSGLRKSILEDFVKSLLTPNDIYDIFLDKNFTDISVFRQKFTIPLKIEVYGYGLERGVKTTKYGCTYGKSKVIYTWARLSTHMKVSLEDKTLYDRIYNISIRNYSWYQGVDKSAGTPYIPFSGKIVLDDNTTLFYEGKIKLLYKVRLTSFKPAYCSNWYTPGKIRAGIYLDISITFRKEHPRDLLILIFDESKYRLVNQRGNLEDSIWLSRYASRNGFAIVVSDSGEPIAFSTGHKILNYWPYNSLARINQGGIEIEAIIYRAR